ncbi:SLATT domain-containing protein [Cyanobium sp. PCC 7001]|uniref:SLATT domain-containing protein n=1 Tax=Cyanobium sp. PCC 7001 TaxID=180281 RepID=UPI001CEDC153|nr:SLATT domain-containing protein [Cyanobium sp. PCC 7001]
MTTEDLDDSVKELLRRTKKTSKSRFRASARLERHHKFSQWTVALLSAALVLVPLAKAFEVQFRISTQYLSALQAILAVLLLAYSLLLGQERFISRAEAMHRNAVELGRFARKLAGLESSNVDDNLYSGLVEEYYSILEKYENHTSSDYLYTLLQIERPRTTVGHVRYIFIWLKATALDLISYSHYIVVLSFSFYIVFIILSAVVRSEGGQ